MREVGDGDHPMDVGMDEKSGSRVEDKKVKNVMRVVEVNNKDFGCEKER